MNIWRKLQLILLFPCLAVLLPFGLVGGAAATAGLLSTLNNADGKTALAMLIVGPLLIATVAVPTLGLYLLWRCISRSPKVVAQSSKSAWSTMVFGLISEGLVVYGAIVNSEIKQSSPSLIGPYLFGVPAILGLINLSLLGKEMVQIQVSKQLAVKTESHKPKSNI